jgi:hydrogenase-4 component B
MLTVLEHQMQCNVGNHRRKQAPGARRWRWIGVAASLAGRHPFRARKVTPWSSASPGVDRGVGYTSSAYANPVHNVLANALLTRAQLVETSAEAVDDTACSRVLTYRVDVVDLIEGYVYRPLMTALLVVSRSARRLQSGRLDAYLA